MKKTLFTLVMLFVVTFSASAQIVTMCNSNVARLDIDGDGAWDTEVRVSNVPGISYMKTGRNFYSELGRLYCINMWKQYERMGVNPASYGISYPGGNGDFSAYASYYMRYVGMSGMGGMVAPMVGGVGMPGNASIAVGGKNFGFSVSVPVRNSNNVGTMYTPNASVGVNINGNYVGASVPVSIVTGKNKKQTRTQTQTRTVAPTTNTRTVQPQTQNQPVQVVGEMSADEVAQMLNSGSYM
jgi:hypothetical protein